jgi:hypothetical protein
VNGNFQFLRMNGTPLMFSPTRRPTFFFVETLPLQLALTTGQFVAVAATAPCRHCR